MLLEKPWEMEAERGKGETADTEGGISVEEAKVGGSLSVRGCLKKGGYSSERVDAVGKGILFVVKLPAVGNTSGFGNNGSLIGDIGL